MAPHRPKRVKRAAVAAAGLRSVKRTIVIVAALALAQGKDQLTAHVTGARRRTEAFMRSG